MRVLVILAMSALTAFTAIQSANAQGAQCGERGTIVSQLSAKHNEQQTVIGLTKDGRLLEIWSSHGSRSFTLLLTWPNLRSCIMAAGQDLDMRPAREFITQFEF
ncbi:MAG: hypothetical protein ACR2PA_17085 [Hyphomicrobiaceae bacterium]